MSPEKGSGQGYDGKDDVWALGCILVGGVLGKPMEDMGLNMQGIFALNRPGVEGLLTTRNRLVSDGVHTVGSDTTSGGGHSAAVTQKETASSQVRAPLSPLRASFPLRAPNRQHAAHPPPPHAVLAAALCRPLEVALPPLARRPPR